MDFYQKMGIVCNFIPYGAVATYGQIALLCGKPKNSRQVGYGLRENLAGIDVPAHRVVNSKGELSGATYFEFYDMQKVLLQEEGVEVTWNGKCWVVDLQKYGWKNTMEDAYVLKEKFGEEKYQMQEVYEECIEYVRKTLHEAGRDSGRRHPFRSRTAHTLRVVKWAERLIEGRDDVDRDVLFMAAIFHDVGYVADELENHQQVSARIFKEYAVSKHFPEDFIEKVAHCISIHSDKERLKQPELLTIEEILLMEADLLDEEGALSICWDGLACGWEGKYSYAESYERTLLEASGKINTQPMVTEKAKQIWRDKLDFLQEYITRLSGDLEQWSV